MYHKIFSHDCWYFLQQSGSEITCIFSGDGRQRKTGWFRQYVMTTLFNWSSYGGQNEDKTLQRSQFCHKGEFRHVSISARQQSLRFGQNVRWSCLYLQGYPVRKAKSYKPILQTTLRNNIFGAHVLETFKRMLATGCLNESNLPTCKNCSVPTQAR